MITYGLYIDLDGKQVDKTPLKHPYSYDSFVTHKNGNKEDITGSVYSDRLLQWDYSKTRKLMKKHFGESGDYYSNREPEQIEEFLRERLEEPNLKLVAMYLMVILFGGLGIGWINDLNKKL